MLVLFETAAGYAIFKLLDENKLTQTDDLYRDFESPEKASRILKLKHFEKFADTTEALSATTAMVEGKLSKSLKKLIKEHIGSEVDNLLVADTKLGLSIKEKFNIQCISNQAVQELMRCIRCQLESLLAGLPRKEMTAMALGLAHSLSRYKLKFSPDKVDTMIVQSVCLLDELDKELNNYVMRGREWYGWHFPELGSIVTDNKVYVQVIQLMGTRDHASTTDMSDILTEEIEEKVKVAAEVSIGTEISDDDIINIQNLCAQILDIINYRSQLQEYLTARMMAIAPNLSVILGEMLGGRFIAKAGSLMNLAKHPASTIQVLGAEKALFRALKTKKHTPKYGLMYNAALVTKSSKVNKGKISRMLAAKAALCIRVDALGEDNTFDLGAKHKANLECRLRMLEQGNLTRISGTGKAKAKFEKYYGKSEVKKYPSDMDATLAGKRKRDQSTSGDFPKKEEPSEGTELTPKQLKKLKKEVTEEEPDDEVNIGASTSGVPKKVKKRIKQEIKEEEDSLAIETLESASPGTEKKKKKKKSISETQVVEGDQGVADITEGTESTEGTGSDEKVKKKKKKNKNKVESEF